MAVILLSVALVIALLLIPLGLPGTWAMVGAALIYAAAVPRGGVTVTVVAGTAALALLAEALEFLLAARFTRRFGGSRRAGWGAVIGGFLGVFAGIPIPIAGPVIGGLLGAFTGAMIGELEAGSDHRTATRAAIGALLGRVAAAATKVAMGAAMAAWILAAVGLHSESR